MEKNGITHSELLFSSNSQIRDGYCQEMKYLNDVPSNFSDISAKTKII